MVYRADGSAEIGLALFFYSVGWCFFYRGRSGNPNCTPGVKNKLCTMLVLVYFAFCCGLLVETLDFGGLGREAP